MSKESSITLKLKRRDLTLSRQLEVAKLFKRRSRNGEINQLRRDLSMPSSKVSISTSIKILKKQDRTIQDHLTSSRDH